MSHPSTTSRKRRHADSEPAKVARAVGLVYVRDDQPGIRRLRSGRGFSYQSPRGKTLRSRTILMRIRALAIPPAWTSVWICPSARGHIQATGFDARGRKQYLYHADWRAIRDSTKFDRLPQFAAALSQVRAKVRRALALPGLSREKVLAAVIRILDVASVRIGNAEYAQENGSFGATTLRNRHVEIDGAWLRLQFRGKSGAQQRIEVRDARLARVVKRCSELPGQLLFQYLDDDGVPHPIGSSDVNAALREWTRAEFTAKDFRTWTGTVSFLRAIQNNGATEGTLTSLIQEVARVLGNTPAVCRKHYIHPGLIAGFVDGSLSRWLAEPTARNGAPAGKARHLDETEKSLLNFLNSRAG